MPPSAAPDKPRAPQPATPDTSRERLAAVVAALPVVDEHPAVKELLDRAAALGREQADIRRQLREAEEQLGSAGLRGAGGFRSPADAEAARLAAGGAIDDAALRNATRAVDGLREREHVLANAVGIVGNQTRYARAEASRSHSDQVREIGLPFIRRAAVALFEAVLANVELLRVHDAVRARGLSPHALAAALPSNPFNAAVIPGGAAEQLHGTKNVLLKLTAAGVFTEPEAAEWRVRFAAAIA